MLYRVDMNDGLEYPAFLGEFPGEPTPWTDLGIHASLLMIN